MSETQQVYSVRKLYKNSECDSCGEHIKEVRLFGEVILCKKCYKGESND